MAEKLYDPTTDTYLAVPGLSGTTSAVLSSDILEVGKMVTVGVDTAYVIGAAVVSSFENSLATRNLVSSASASWNEISGVDVSLFYPNSMNPRVSLAASTVYVPNDNSQLYQDVLQSKYTGTTPPMGVNVLPTGQDGVTLNFACGEGYACLLSAQNDGFVGPWSAPLFMRTLPGNSPTTVRLTNVDGSNYIVESFNGEIGNAWESETERDETLFYFGRVPASGCICTYNICSPQPFLSVGGSYSGPHLTGELFSDLYSFEMSGNSMNFVPTFPNSLETINFHDNPGLSTSMIIPSGLSLASLSNNAIKTLNVTSADNLNTLTVSNHPNLSSLDITGIPSLTSFSMSNCPSTKFLYLSRTQTGSISITNCPVLSALSASNQIPVSANTLNFITTNLATPITMPTSCLLQSLILDNAFKQTVGDSVDSLERCTSLMSFSYANNRNTSLNVTLPKSINFNSLSIINNPGLTALTLTKPSVTTAEKNSGVLGQLNTLNASGNSLMTTLVLTLPVSGASNAHFGPRNFNFSGCKLTGPYCDNLVTEVYQYVYSFRALSAQPGGMANLSGNLYIDGGSNVGLTGWTTTARNYAAALTATYKWNITHN